MKKYFGLSVFILGLLAPQLGYCWGDEGHSIVALVAQKVLKNDKSPEAQTALTTISGILGETTFDTAAEWPDLVKEQSRACNKAPYAKDPNYKNKNSSAICDAYKYTSSWHFVNADGTTYSSDPSSNNYYQGDLVVILRILSHALMGKEDSTISPVQSYTSWKTQCEKKPDHNCKKEALEFLMHFMGDIHQPLHSGALCDVGGNSQYVEFFGQAVVTPKPSWCNGQPPSCANHELHAVWDTELLLHKGDNVPINYTSNDDYATRLLELMGKRNATASADPTHCVTAAPNGAIDIDDASFPSGWINESLCYMPQIYNFPDASLTKNTKKSDKRKVAQEEHSIPNRCQSERAVVSTVGNRKETNYSAFSIGQRYYDDNITTINERLYWAGSRLATLLKVIYGQGDQAKQF
jgi:hypothetical protein